MRFSRLKDNVGGVSQKMLTRSLRDLERDGLVTRTMFMEVPPRVEYELTELGKGLLVQLIPLWSWVINQTSLFKIARKTYDDKLQLNQ